MRSESRLPLGPRKQDAALLAVLVAIGLIELADSTGLSWNLPAAITFLLMPTVLWRRSRPLAMVAIAFGTTLGVELVALAAGIELATVNTGAFVLLLSYALLRWGSRRDVLFGAPIVLATALVGLIADGANPSDFIGGFAVVLSSMALGAAIRSRASVHAHELEQVKLREREQLARDLHDTVAHHVSAIAIRAQAGLATAAINPTAATDALRVIEAEASRTLAEMRAMVRLLRRDEPAELEPTPRISDLQNLAVSAEGLDVELKISGDLDALSPALSAAIYRLAQESITNARRHARHATRIEVAVTVDASSVHLSVADNGDPARDRSFVRGYGLIGMSERAELLGGTCSAGPNPDRGWTVAAVLPRNGRTP